MASVLGAVLVFAVAVWGGCERWTSRSDASTDTSGVYEFRAIQSPEGTGKFYMGREIAAVTGHPGAEWLERPTRETQELPGRVVRGLDLSSSDVVADIGAGTGYFTFRIAPKVPYGKVLAVDIQPEMLEIIHERKDEQDAHNVELILGTERDPNLPEGEVDVVLMVDAYHEFTYPREMMEHVVDALKPGGRVVLIEYRGEDPTVPVDPLHKMTLEQARKEMEAVGLRWRETKDILPQQHFMIFEKPVE